MDSDTPTASRQHVTVCEDHPLLGVTAAGLKNLEEHGFKAGDHVQVTVTLRKVVNE